MAGFGGSVKLQGESEYKKALKSITDNLTVLSSEMKVVSSSFNRGEDSISSLSQKHDILTKKLKSQNEALAEAEKMLNEAKTSTDSNATTVQKWQNEVNKAKTEVNKTTTELRNNESTMKDLKNANVENTQELKKFEEQERKAGESTNLLANIIKGNLLSDVIKTGINALANGIKKVGSALVDIGKSSVDSFANYEQLIGGVETLFKDSADVVTNYANNAYKTSGLSANEYMETVTSFSASLLQSLNGDTAKSAQVADMAITDMSDNANKMGTDMSMIQSAYQGFAKQNYTMLDNLKLGYGGTKTEMERLLADAEKISGVKYDISNLNDVYQAIHVIQGELGITGTTAKEASTTIQGSISSMKSAWSNLLTGLADGNADFSELINNLIDSAFSVVDNILPVVKDLAENIIDVFIPSILEFMQNNIPEILDCGMQIIQTIITGIQENLPFIIQTAMQIIKTLTITLINMLPQILQIGITVIVELIKGIAQSLPELIPAIYEAELTMVETLLDNIDLIIDAGIQLIMGLADGLITALPIIIDKIPVIIDKLVNAITNNLPKLIEAGILLIVKLTEGLIKAIPQLLSKIPQIIMSIVNGFAPGLGQMIEVGSNLVRGLWQGIINVKDWILDKIKGFGQSVLNGIKDFFGIHSPSTLFRDEVGKYMAQGIGIGFTNEMTDITKDMQNAIPTKFDAAYDLNSSKTDSSNYNRDELKSFIVDIIREYKPTIYLDKEILGEFNFNYANKKYGNLVVS